jgi:hypothetical protein
MASTHTKKVDIGSSKTTKLILLDSLLQEAGDACLRHPPPLREVGQASWPFQIAFNAKEGDKILKMAAAGG